MPSTGAYEADWEFFMGATPYDDSLAVSLMSGRASAELLPPIAERLETWSGDEAILPGMDVRGAPGHTPGSTVIVLSSGTERAMLLGDVVHCPADDDWEMIGDIDKELAQRTHEALARELEGSDIPAGRHISQGSNSAGSWRQTAVGGGRSAELRHGVRAGDRRLIALRSPRSEGSPATLATVYPRGSRRGCDLVPTRRELLKGSGGAALAVGLAASSTGIHAAGAATTPGGGGSSRANLSGGSTPGVFSVMTYGATGNGSTDDTTAIEATFAAAQGSSVTVGVPGGAVFFPAGEYVISSTITLTRFSGQIYGVGVGQSPAYSPQPGHSSVIRWNGNNSTPMFEIIDSEWIHIHDLRLEGNNTNSPTYGFQMQNNGGITGCNHLLTFRNVFIGRFRWSSQGTNSGVVQSCVGYTGTNGNNDQFLFDRCQFSHPSSYGFYAPNRQSTWGDITNCLFDTCGTAGLYTGTDINLVSPSFNGCAIDIATNTANSPNVQVYGWYSENSMQMANLGPSAKLTVYGGTFQCGTIQSGGQVLIAAYPSNNQTISLKDITFTQMETPADVQFQFGPESPSNVGKLAIKVDNCRGIQSGQLVLSGSFWASSPMSRGVVEWISWDGVDYAGTRHVYQFRNELATSGAGTRTKLDTSVWDANIAGAS